MIRFVFPNLLIAPIKIADSEKQSNGAAARIDSVKTLIPYSCFMIGSKGPIRIRPARIFDEIANIGKPRRRVLFIFLTS